LASDSRQTRARAKAISHRLILIPRTLLTEIAGRQDALPLAPDICRFMEKRFGADLRDVRIHTDGASARLCDMLHSRALTAGNDIHFATGAYAPHTAQGLRLLAHELVHVLQQRAGKGSTPRQSALRDFLTVGDENDPCEHEANRLAAEVFDCRLRPWITPDSSGSIRRAIRVLEWTAKLNLKHSGATPGINYNMGGAIHEATAVLHLTRNSRMVVLNATKFAKPHEISAMRIEGIVDVQADPKDTKGDVQATWSFHLAQVFQDLMAIGYYAGETQSDGSMKLNFAGPANYSGYGKFVPDGDPDNPNPANIPYAEYWTGLTNIDPRKGIWRAHVVADDHPNVTFPLVKPNFAASHKDNFLYRVARQFGIITTLVAVDQKLDLVYPLAYVEWGVNYLARLRWRLDASGRHMVDPAVLTGSAFVVGKVTLGTPRYPGVEALIKNPIRDADKMYNRISERAQLSVLMSGTNTQDVEALATWSSMVPTDHFK
jgi:hypothetical protein